MKRRPGMTLPARNLQPSCERATGTYRCGCALGNFGNVTKDLDFSLADRKAELLRWLSEEGRFAPDTSGLLQMLCEKLTVLGAPIARAPVHDRTLHPEFRGISRIWRRGQSTEFRTSRHGIESTSDYQNSPLHYVIETGQWLYTFLIHTTDLAFPVLPLLRAQGITHYVM